MQSNKLIVLGLIIIAILSYTSCRTDGENKNIKSSKEKINAEISPPPGNADVECTINKEIIEGKKFLRATVKIKEVYGYGPSTPILPAGSEITVNIPKQLSDKDTAKLKSGKDVHMRISFSKGFGNDGEWRFVAFNKNIKQK